MKTMTLTAICVMTALSVTACKAKTDAKPEPVKVVQSDITRKTTADRSVVTDMQVSTLANPNTVNLDMLKKLPGMPENIPAKIMAARPFADAQAFDAFLSEHANAPTKEAIYKVVFIPMPLNTTPEADFMIIPGVGKKMAHEFEEYRPYKDWAQFNREIGKYVDDKEVARLRQYVTLN